MFFYPRLNRNFLSFRKSKRVILCALLRCASVKYSFSWFKRGSNRTLLDTYIYLCHIKYNHEAIKEYWILASLYTSLFSSSSVNLYTEYLLCMYEKLNSIFKTKIKLFFSFILVFVLNQFASLFLKNFMQYILITLSLTTPPIYTLPTCKIVFPLLTFLKSSSLVWAPLKNGQLAKQHTLKVN